MIGVMVLIYSVITRSQLVVRAAYLLMIAGTLSTIPVVISGESTEESVEHLSGINSSMIEEHEESALTFSYLNYVLGVLSIVGLYTSLKKNNSARTISLAALLVSLVTAYFAYQTGSYGGQIRHTEIYQTVPQSEGSSE
jgi:uncharacterized membrane protein